MIGHPVSGNSESEGSLRRTSYLQAIQNGMSYRGVGVKLVAWYRFRVMANTNFLGRKFVKFCIYALVDMRRFWRQFDVC